MRGAHSEGNTYKSTADPLSPYTIFSCLLSTHVLFCKRLSGNGHASSLTHTQVPLWLETDSHQGLTFAASIVDCGAAAAGSPPGERRPCRTDMSGFRQAPKKLLECRSGTQDCLWKSLRMEYVTQISLPPIDGGGNLFKAFRKAEAVQGQHLYASHSTHHHR